MTTFIKKYPIWSFLIINYLISWTFLYPSYQIILKNDGFTPLALIGFIGAYGPTIAAIIIQMIIDRKGTHQLLKKIISVKATISLYAFIIIIPVLFYCISYFTSLTYYNESINTQWLQATKNIMLWFLLALPFGPMGEELGWRGFMLPQLLKSHSVIKSTVLVGLAWGIWHMASFTFPGAAIPSFMEVNVWTIGFYFMNTIALSMIFTYVYLKGNGSVFHAILLHAFFNASANVAADLIGETQNTSALVLSYVVNIILAGIVGYLLIRKTPHNQKVILNS